VNQPKNKKGAWIQVAVLAALVIVASVALWYWHEPLWAFFSDQEGIQAWIQSFGPWGPVVSIALNAAQVLAAPIPGQIIGISNGYLYGLWMGTLYSMIGLVVGRALAMALGRWFGRRLVERLVDPEQLTRWDGIIHRRGPLFFFLIFLLPFLPDDLVCFLVGLSPLPLLRMIVLSALGGLPGVFVSCWVGANANDLPWWAWIPLIAGVAALGWIFWRYEARVESAMVGLVDRLSPKRAQADVGRGTKDKDDPSSSV
jgi:uncharacterized membrane protein YdjX (TVP38/TMEM64 family)